MERISITLTNCELKEATSRSDSLKLFAIQPRSDTIIGVLLDYCQFGRPVFGVEKSQTLYERGPYPRGRRVRATYIYIIYYLLEQTLCTRLGGVCS